MATRDLVIWSKDCPSITHRRLCRRDFENSDTRKDYHHLRWWKPGEFKSDCCPLRSLHVLPNPGGSSNGKNLSRFRYGKGSFISLSSCGPCHFPSKHSCHQQIYRPEKALCLCWIDYFLLYGSRSDLRICPYPNMIKHHQQ